MVKVLDHPSYYAHRFVAAHPSNYTAGREGNKVRFVVVHITQGSYEGSISWSQNASSNVSWTYIVSEEGHTTQQVSEKHTIYTNSNWYINQRGISLEHEGYHPRAASAVPKAQLHASAKLVAGICLRHGIPIDRDHIFGHTEIQGVAKPCPSGWPWGEYIRLVKRYAGGKSPSEPVKPVPDTRIKWVNYVYDSKSAWGAKIAAAMYAALTAVGVRGGLTEKAAKAAADAREQAGVYTFLIGSDAVRRAKRYQKEFTDLDISYNTSGAVRVVTPSYRDRAKWRIADFCEEKKLDKGAAIRAFESAMGKTDDGQGGGEKMSDLEKGIQYVLGLVKFNQGYRLWKPGEDLRQPGFWGGDGAPPDYITHTFCSSVPNLAGRVVGVNPPRNGGIYNGGTRAYKLGYGAKMVPFKLSEFRRGDIAFVDFQTSWAPQGHIGIALGGPDDKFLQSFRGAGEDGLNKTFTLRQSHDGGYYTSRLPREAWIG